MKKLLPFFFAPLLGACVSGTVYDQITVDQIFTYTVPTASAASKIVPSSDISVSQSATVDVSSAVSKLEKFGTLSVSALSSEVKANFDTSAVSHISISLNQLVLVDQDVSPSGETTPLTVIPDGSDILDQLSSGPCTLTITAMVNANELSSVSLPNNDELSLEYVLSLQASESITKGI